MQIWLQKLSSTGMSAEAKAYAGAPRRSRTTNLQIRSLTLYPIELWAHMGTYQRDTLTAY